jgi:organic radical activating enzyme
MDLTPYKECPAHKNSVYIGTDEKCRPCCYYKHYVPITEITSWDDYQEKIQKTDIESGCKHCIDLESNGSKISHRLQMDPSNDISIAVCPNNVCNLKCTTCSPEQSSNWIQDADKMGWLNEDRKKYVLELPHLTNNKLSLCRDIISSADHNKKIIMTLYGGEPMINPEVIEFVDWLETQPNAKNIHASFITNGTKIPSKFEEWIGHFRHSNVVISIDSVRECNDYLRYGSKWSVIEQNFMKYADIATANSNFNFGVHMTLSWMNAYYFADFCEWVVSVSPPDKAIGSLHMTKLVGPSYYSLDNWTPELKQTVFDANVPRVKKLIETTDGFLRKQLEYLLECYETSLMTYVSGVAPDKTDCSEGLYIMHDLDELRNTNFDETFSEITKLIKQ